MESLYEIAVRNEAVKINHSVKHYVTQVYPTYFESIRNEKLSLLEIGIKRGGSLKMWRDYFPNGTIYGLDIIRTTFLADELRIKTFRGSQSEENTLQKLVNYTGKLDIVIDDGAHTSNTAVPAFEFLWSYVKPGGFYVIEDLYPVAKRDRKHEHIHGINVEISMFDVLHDIVNDVATLRRYDDYKNDIHVEYIHFWGNMVVMRKPKKNG